MKEVLIKKLSSDLSSTGDCLKGLWFDYVKEKGEVSLNYSFISLADGSCECMDKMVYEDNDVTLITEFGKRYSLDVYCKIETLLGLHDAVFLTYELPSGE